MNEKNYRFLSRQQYCVFGNRDFTWTALNVYETEEFIMLVAELAGAKSDSLHVEVTTDMVRIQGIRQIDPPDELVRIHRMEIAAGPFDIEVPIHMPVDIENVRSRYRDGLLEIILPLRKQLLQRINVHVHA